MSRSAGSISCVDNIDSWLSRFNGPVLDGVDDRVFGSRKV